MATSDYRRWVAAGRPFRRPPWLTQLRAQAAAAGVRFLGDLGNEEHLQADRPQDHTPFSYTEWPVQVSEYVINAIDLAGGPWAYRLLGLAKTGRAPWVKYINIDGRHYSVKNGWKPVASSDLHGHVSGRTDHTWTGLNGINPFVEQGSDMQPSDNARLQWAAHMQETPDDDGKMLEVIEGGDAKPVANPVAGRPYALGVVLNRIEGKLDELLEARGAVTAREPRALADMPDVVDPGDKQNPADER